MVGKTRAQKNRALREQREVEDWLSVTRAGISLGLLRSRPDPVGEWHVHKPAFQEHSITASGGQCKRQTGRIDKKAVLEPHNDTKAPLLP